MNKKILGIIPARAGSKRIPNKNLNLLGDKPLIQYTIEAGINSSKIDRLVLTTDDKNIIELASKFDIEIPFVRPDELSGDTSSSYDVVIHCLNWLSKNYNYHPDAVMLLQPTCPFRDSYDIDNAIEEYLNSSKESLISASKVFQHPCDCFKIVDGKIQFADAPIKGREFPEYYFDSGAIYITSVNFLKDRKIFFDESPIIFNMSKEHSIDIDEFFELRVADSLIHYKKNNRYIEEVFINENK